MNKLWWHGLLDLLHISAATRLRLRHCLGVILLSGHSLVCPTTLAQPSPWQHLTLGIDYTQIPVKQVFPGGKIHAFRIDLRQKQLSIRLANDFSEQSLYIKQFAHLADAKIALNGGFFDPQKRPLGLRINDYQTQNPLRNVSWWGVFYIAHQHPHIVAHARFKPHPAIQMAIQAGPRILINGHIPKLRDNQHNRSAVCISGKRELILLITEYAPMSTTELAQAIKRSPAQGGLGCVNALNLDGGSSSQLFAAIDDFKLYVNNFSSVSDALIVK